MKEFPNAVTLKGNPMTLVGNEVKVGDQAPDFTVVANDLSNVTFGNFKGKKIILSAVPSLDTPVCDIETRRFNEEAVKLGNGVTVLTISTDLPFAQKRWCGASGVKNVQVLSDHRETSFGNNYGVLIKGLRILARAIFVVDANGVIQYKQVVKEIANEPDYSAVLEAVKKLK